jgi:hypothetical protein
MGHRGNIAARISVTRYSLSVLSQNVRRGLYPFTLQDEGGPIKRRAPLFLFPDRQLSLA